MLSKTSRASAGFKLVFKHSSSGHFACSFESTVRAMIALKLFVFLEVLGALWAIPIATQFNVSDEVDLTWRLPKAVYPISYRIELETRVHDHGDREFSGMEMIALDIREATNRIVLHSKELVIEDVVLISGESIIDEIAFFEDETRDFLIIESLEELQPGMRLDVFIQFRVDERHLPLKDERHLPLKLNGSEKTSLRQKVKLNHSNSENSCDNQLHSIGNDVCHSNNIKFGRSRRSSPRIFNDQKNLLG
jgi:Peptidase M1 N-terminal domain